LKVETSIPACPLPGLRLGGLSYLNAVPLQAGLRPAPKLFSPAEAVQAFLAEELDVALLPLAAGPELQAQFGADIGWVRGVGIAARREAYSVFVAHRRQCRGGEPTCFVDSASRTSRALLEMVQGDLVQHFTGKQVDAIAEADHVFLIGDAAIDFRREHAELEWFYEDLGEVWRKKTGRPMVFAVWMVRRERLEHRMLEVAGWLRQVARANAAMSVKELGQFWPEEREEFLARYWRKNLTYELGEEEEAGAQLFLEKLSGSFAVNWI
jgi:chorismate dehydratase